MRPDRSYAHVCMRDERWEVVVAKDVEARTVGEIIRVYCMSMGSSVRVVERSTLARRRLAGTLQQCLARVLLSTPWKLSRPSRGLLARWSEICTRVKQVRQDGSQLTWRFQGWRNGCDCDCEGCCVRERHLLAAPPRNRHPLRGRLSLMSLSMQSRWTGQQQAQPKVLPPSLAEPSRAQEQTSHIGNSLPIHSAKVQDLRAERTLSAAAAAAAANLSIAAATVFVPMSLQPLFRAGSLVPFTLGRRLQSDSTCRYPRIPSSFGTCGKEVQRNGLAMMPRRRVDAVS
ncbi:hypothetical protein ANO11243_005480 [Dothideomycetidae sp. 11243]|nr:hypothetical protein ANO11243_005480 [fungal sp. No.11243]